jgi:hypothetical protein
MKLAVEMQDEYGAPPTDDRANEGVIGKNFDLSLINNDNKGGSSLGTNQVLL